MNLTVSIVFFVIGLGLIIWFAERLVKGVVRTSLGFGISAFLVSVLFVGFDPENLALGAVASFEGVAGIALGSIVGAAMVAMALAFGITALIAPMEFRQAPKPVLAVPILAILLLGLVSVDGELSRLDGGILLLGFSLSVLYLLRLTKKGVDIHPTGEVAETLEEAEGGSKWKAFGLLLLSLAGIIAGSEMLLAGSRVVIGGLGLSETVFGMTILALLVSIEELARELPAERRGRPDISYGNVAGSILAFFLFNAGIIASVHPVPVSDQVLVFYLPMGLMTTLVVSAFMLRRKVSRWAGGVLLGLYLIFFVGGYLL
ncbi:MAG: sodium:calcium antiporter [Fidelibacterota bacterium]